MGIETHGLLDTEGSFCFLALLSALNPLIRWVMMYNANLDKSTDRKTLPELRLELRAWEERQKGPKYAVEDPSAHEVSLDSISLRLN